MQPKQDLYQALSPRARMVMATRLVHIVRTKAIERECKATLLESLEWAGRFHSSMGDLMFIKATRMIVARRIRDNRSLNRLAARCVREADESADALRTALGATLAKIK